MAKLLKQTDKKPKTEPKKENAEEFEHIDIEMQCKLSGDKQFAFGICKAAEIDEEERTVKAIISSDAIDRDGEILLPKGMRHDNFVKNPVVPWSHNASEPPVGRALWLHRGRKKIEAKVKFAMTERAEEVWQLFKGGFLKAFSVGFMPLKGHRPTPEEIKKNPDWADARFIFDEWELLEFSPVTVPANPEALAQAVKNKSISLSDEMITELKVEAVEEIDDFCAAHPKAKLKYSESMGEYYCPECCKDDEIEVVIPVKEFKPEKKEISVKPVFGIDKI